MKSVLPIERISIEAVGLPVTLPLRPNYLPDDELESLGFFPLIPLIGAGVSLLGGLFKKKPKQDDSAARAAAAAQQQQLALMQQQAQNQKNMLLYGGLGVGGLAIVYLLAKKK